MDIYLVGGAVRDKLLNYPVHEYDWVVVGATPQQLIEQGYRQVGRDFPVFLHPTTNEESALARTERKTGPGYTGFSCYSAPDVTLEQDLLRRDLTINAIAEGDQGQLFDPYGGQRDLQHKILRHVSENFIEDPLRVLRTARFAARYHHLGFSIADETKALMSDIVANGELEHLAVERVWTELDKALGEKAPQIFIKVLRECGALQVLLPELEELFEVSPTEKNYPEIDTGEHVLLSLIEAAKLSSNTAVRFAVLMRDLGKSAKSQGAGSSHIDNQQREIKLVSNICSRLKAPREHRDLALLTCQYNNYCHRALELKPSTLLKTLEALDAFRRPERFRLFLLSCEADVKGRKGFQEIAYPQSAKFLQAFHAALSVDTKTILARGFEGRSIGEEIRRQRINAIAQTGSDTP
jgi:tRNA nucleotidyltransferase (CCA-adding enzyme)